MSSSSAILTDQYWYTNGSNFRDASDLILFKKRQAIRQLAVPVNEPVRRPILQSLQNRTSYQFAYLDCTSECVEGGFPQVRLTNSTPI